MDILQLAEKNFISPWRWWVRNLRIKNALKLKIMLLHHFARWKKKRAATATKHCVQFYQHLILRWLAGFASALPFFFRTTALAKPDLGCCHRTSYDCSHSGPAWVVGSNCHSWIRLGWSPVSPGFRSMGSLDWLAQCPKKLGEEFLQLSHHLPHGNSHR